MATVRTRSQSIVRTQGFARRRFLNQAWIVASNSNVNGYYNAVCTDVVGNRFGDNGLTITKSDKRGIRTVTWSNDTAGWDHQLVDYMLTGHIGTIGHLAITPDSDAVVATGTLARSNPSRPYVSIPNFLFELKDLPGMIRDIGHLKLILQSPNHIRRLRLNREGARFTANHYLGAQMGWAPLISDLQKILGFQDRVENQYKALDKLFNQKGGLHRSVGKPRRNPDGSQRLGLWTKSVTSRGSSTIESAAIANTLLTAAFDKKTTVTKWGSVRWTSTALPSTRYSNDDLRRLAKRIVFGGYITPKTIWEAMPWSWLVDWFTNVGDYLDAHTNVIPVQASAPCIMTHTLTEVSYTRTDAYQFIQGGDGSATAETKSRIIGSASLSATVPFLSGRQLSILGALAIQRLR